MIDEIEDSLRYDLLPDSQLFDQLQDQSIAAVRDNCEKFIKFVDKGIKNIEARQKGDASSLKNRSKYLSGEILEGETHFRVFTSITEAAYFWLRWICNVGTVERLIEAGNYPAWQALTRYWSVVKKLMRLQAECGVDPHSITRLYEGRPARSRCGVEDAGCG